MALQGSIQDFGLADIFQLIGIQRKSGILTLDNGKETVQVTFHEGVVVGAENVGVKIEDLLGNVLVRTGRLAQPQLDEALAVQRETLQRLGYILVDRQFITEADLRAALQTQVEQIVYRLFRWRSGDYRFDSHEHVEADPSFTPIGAETILMEGARMVDEWPIIERRIRSDRTVFRKTEAAARVDAPVRSIMDEDVHLDLGPSEDGTEEITLAADERNILRLVDGTANAQEIAERSTLGEFDTYRILADLLTRNLIEETEVAETYDDPDSGRRTGRLATAALLAVVLAAAALGVATLPFNRYTAWNVAASPEVTERLRTYASRGRIERVERAVRLFFLDTGQLPDDLELLVGNGYLARRDVLDPWGRPYLYELTPTAYSVRGRDGEGVLSAGLTVTRRLTPVQRRLLSDGIAGGP